MPSISSHMAIAKRVSEILHIDDPDFYRGNLLPDLFRNKTKSHYKIKGKKYLIPNIKYVKSNFDFSKMENLGILTHLLLDKYYLEEYLNNIEDDVFKNKIIYKDYDILNKDIIKHFNLDVNKISSILKNYDKEVDESKLNSNIKCLYLKKDGNTIYLDKDKFIRFLDIISARIAEEIREMEVCNEK